MQRRDAALCPTADACSWALLFLRAARAARAALIQNRRRRRPGLTDTRGLGRYQVEDLLHLRRIEIPDF
jgi:hypothetical protein